MDMTAAIAIAVAVGFSTGFCLGAMLTRCISRRDAHDNFRAGWRSAGGQGPSPMDPVARIEQKVTR